MHWVVNSALSREQGFHALLHHLEAQGQPTTLVSKPPFVERLVDPTNGKTVVLDIEEPVFVVGTTSMRRISIDHGWNPGYVDAPTQRECIDAWGDRMLNAGAVFGEMGGIAPPSGGRIFVRPDEGSKAFNGTVMDADAFCGWRSSMLEGQEAGRVHPGQRITISPVRTIWSEYRCIVVEGRYVTGSRYKTGRTVAYSPDVGNRIIRFVEEAISTWNPRIALCVDVADTPEGLKIIETNDVSSCGFYTMDMGRFVSAIAGMDL